MSTSFRVIRVFTFFPLKYYIVLISFLSFCNHLYIFNKKLIQFVNKILQNTSMIILQAALKISELCCHWQLDLSIDIYRGLSKTVDVHSCY